VKLVGQRRKLFFTLFLSVLGQNWFGERAARGGSSETASVPSGLMGNGHG
jgi:hypothetical protein